MFEDTWGGTLCTTAWLGKGQQGTVCHVVEGRTALLDFT